MILKYCVINALLIAATIAFSLPPPTGNYALGTVSFELIDYGRQDPFSSTPGPRALMLSVYYPMRQTTDHTTSPAFYLPAKTAATFADGFGVSQESLQSLRMHAKMGAPYDRRENFPVLLFSPGFRVPRLLYGALAENLASYGYLVIVIDHPYDSIWVEYPDGRVVTPELDQENRPRPPTVDDAFSMNQAINVRVQDLSFVLDQLLGNTSVFAENIPNFPSTNELVKAKIGVLGHSLGGASSATAMLRDRRLLCGASLDGKLSGSVIDQGLDRPFLLVGAEGNTLANVAGWLNFWANLRGFRSHLVIKGTVHSSFEDISLLGETYAQASATGAVPPNFLGEHEATRGSRAYEITTAYTISLFDMCFKGGSGLLLKGPHPRYPEVLFED